MTDYYVRICAYGDLSECKRAIASVPEGVPVHVCDGRYATFEGDTNLTTGLEAHCADTPNVTYHAPPSDRLPFGHGYDGPLTHRPGVWDKAVWMEEVLPQDEWTLKLDADETLERFDADLDALNPRFKYAVAIPLSESAKDMAYITRLWVPRYWTPWLDDSHLPRTIFPRDTPVEVLYRIWTESEWTAIRFLRRQMCDAVEIHNHGGERPTSYRRRRADHLERIGRDDRWREVKQDLDA